MKESGFVHLHIHTEYSSPYATCRLEELMEKAKAWNMKSLAITDKGAVHGAIRFSELAEQHGLHPVIGCEMKVAGTDESLILLAVSNRGYEQIVEWLNRGFHHPASQGDVIALSGGRNGIIHRFLATGRMELAVQKALEYAEWFGKNHFYLEVQHHGFPEDQALIERTVRLSRKTGIPLVATHDVHYLTREDASLLDLLQNRKQDAKSLETIGSFYLPSPDEMKEKFQTLPDALNNTVLIAKRCRFLVNRKGKMWTSKVRSYRQDP